MIDVFDQYVLLAILRLHPEGYGITIREEIAARTGYLPSTASIYLKLGHLERQGLIKSRVGRATAKRGGRSKKHFVVTPKGRSGLRSARRAFAAMSAGIEL